MWCIPAAGAAFVAAMEPILDLYELAYDPARPLVCFDESSKQLIAETRLALPASPGQVRRYDYEYKRNGARNLFLFLEPLAGWRHVEVTERRTKLDFAHQMRWLVDVARPDVDYIKVVLDHLNTHTYAALYEAFEPAEAMGRRLASLTIMVSVKEIPMFDIVSGRKVALDISIVTEMMSSESTGNLSTKFPAELENAVAT